MSGTGIPDPNAPAGTPAIPPAAPAATSPVSNGVQTPPSSESPPNSAPPAAAAPAANPNQALLDRIDRLTRDKHDLARELEVARRGQVPAGTPQAPSPPVSGTPPVAAAPVAQPSAPVFDAAEIERRAEALASQRLAAQDFQQKVGAIAAEGLKTHPADWAPTIANLQRINALDPDSINAIHELGNASEIVYALGKDLNEAARIAALPPAARGVAYARLADRVKADAAKQISGAPPPPGAEVNGSAPSSSAPSDRDSMAEWERKRKATSPRWGGRAA